MARTPLRAVLGGAPHLIAVAPAVVVLVAERGRLTDRLASHFTSGGVVDGYMGHGAVLATTAGLGIGLAVAFAVVAGLSAESAAVSSRDIPRFAIAFSWAVAAFIGVLLYEVVAVNLGHPDASGVSLPPSTFLIGLGATVVAGAIGWLVAPRTPHGAHEPASVAAVPIGATEQVSWSRTTTVVWLPILGGVLLAVGIAFTAVQGPGAGIVLIVVGALIATQGRVRVTVDRRGLTVVLGVLGLPRVHIPAEDITSATAADVSPASFGGWGYRFVPGGSGVIMRSGPALVVTRRSGRRFTVTVDDAATAAGVLGGVTGRPC